MADEPDDFMVNLIAKMAVQPLALFLSANLTVVEMLIIALVRKEALTANDVRNMLAELKKYAEDQVGEPNTDAATVLMICDRLQKSFFGTAVTPPTRPLN